MSHHIITVDPPRGWSSFLTTKAAIAKMTEKERIQAMTMVKEGRATVDQIVAVIIKREQERERKKAQLQQQQQQHEARGRSRSPSPQSKARRNQQAAQQQQPQSSSMARRRQQHQQLSPGQIAKHFSGFDDAFGGKANSVTRTATTTPMRHQQQQQLNHNFKLVKFFPGNPLGLMTAGPVVTRVNADSQAAQQGVQVGWTIFSVENKRVQSNQVACAFLVYHSADESSSSSSSSSSSPSSSCTHVLYY